MSVRVKASPVAKQRLRQAQIGTDQSGVSRAHSDVTGAVRDLEKQVGTLNGLTRSPPTVTGSKGGNAALASLISVLVAAGLVKDGTT